MGEVGPNRLEWEQARGHVQRSSCGYQVTATREVDGWLFSAWAPESDPELRHVDWYAAHCKQHYGLGDAVPSRRRLLGVAVTAVEARALCESDARDLELVP